MNKKLSICNILKKELINNFEIKNFIKEIEKSWKKYINNISKSWQDIYLKYIYNIYFLEMLNINKYFINILTIIETDISNYERTKKIFELQKIIITNLLENILKLLIKIIKDINLFMNKKLKINLKNINLKNINISMLKNIEIDNTNKKIILYNLIIEYVNDLYNEYNNYKKYINTKFKNKEILKYFKISENSENSENSKIINRISKFKIFSYKLAVS